MRLKGCGEIATALATHGEILQGFACQVPRQPNKPSDFQGDRASGAVVRRIQGLGAVAMHA